MQISAHRAVVSALCLSALVACVAGCGGPSRPAVHPVTGHVFFQKTTPAAGAFVVFQPVTDGLEKAMAARPFAKVESDGSFSLTTYEAGDGAPEGEYGVTVVWAPPAASKGPRITDGGATLPDKLGGRYGNPKKPALKASVKKGENTFEFDVQ
jgi:hypothetical protein